MWNTTHLRASSSLAFIVALFPLFAYAPIAGETPDAGRFVSRATIIFGGDMMFDRTVRTAIDKNGGDFIFSCISPVLADADFVVANLEGPITPNVSVSEASSPGDEFNYTFTFPDSTAELLFAHKIIVVNLGNNHIQNFGWEGVRSTIIALENAGVAYFGDPVNLRVAEVEANGVRLAFIGYNEFGSTSPATSAAPTTIAQIQIERRKGFLPIVYTHWGVEYATTSSAYSHELAHSFIDAGAEIVIGSHPHVVEENEIYKNKHIYYSLGNFIFDQYFNDDVRAGLLLDITFSQDGVVRVKEIPIHLETDRRTCPVG
ncbi:MAG: CapA family protein [bacterium]|nr:CapA family protein [bacterium]